MRIAVPQNFVLGDMEDAVARDFEAALAKLSKAGARIEKLQLPEFDDIPRINAKAGFSAPEALAWHADLIARSAAGYDPRVLVRIKRGAEQSAVDYVNLVRERAKLIADVTRRLAGYDVHGDADDADRSPCHRSTRP